MIDLKTCRLASQGAEAVRAGKYTRWQNRSSQSIHTSCVDGGLQRIWEGEYLGRPVMVKQRFSKQYRHPALDSKLTLSRLKQARASAGRQACTALHARHRRLMA